MRAILFLSLVALLNVAPDLRAAGIAWQPWSDDAFAQARREHKFVLLDLQAVWCHWCHVMDKETYSDPAVIALINARYIAVRVDQDARPDLSNRYEDYGWPATVVFAADGSEIVKRQGYLPPREMTSMLQAIIADPSPGPSVTNAPHPGGGSFADPQQLRAAIRNGYDTKLGAWGGGHKFLDWDNTEYLMMRGLDGDAESAARARQTLAGAMKLVDPVWGGADQYSIDDWDHPHFEKLIQMQAEDMRIFALAYTAYHDPAYLAAARKIHDYVAQFLTSPDGAVYVSQDADIVDGQAPEPYYLLDDAGRRKLGVPRVDKHVYARENGWWIEALCQLYAATADRRYRAEAVRAAQWIVDHRATAGGFRHGDQPEGLLYLGDTLFMGRGFLALGQVTADPAWTTKSEQAADFIRRNFAVTGHDGFATATSSRATGEAAPQPEFDENVALARWTNLLAHDYGREADRELAASALRYAGANASSRFAYVGGYLLALGESRADPLHVAVLGSRHDAVAADLFMTALGAPFYFKQVDRVDPVQAKPGALAMYPHLDKPAAYLCANQTCSAPVFSRAALMKLLERAKAP